VRAVDAVWLIRDLRRTLESASLFVRCKPDCAGASCSPPQLPECDCGAYLMQNEIQRVLEFSARAERGPVRDGGGEK